jgi:hypothetical protein
MLNLTRWIVLLTLGLTACSGPAASPTPVFPTPQPPTLAPTLPPVTVFPPTETLAPLPATSTPPIAFITETPTPQTACANDAAFLSDLTVPDGAQFLPSQTLTKKWSVQNSGSCDWGADYRLVLVSGDSMGAADELALYPARAGTNAVWEIPMAAPLVPGEYVGRWQARDPAGNLFGDVMFIKIEVIPLPDIPTAAP